MQTLPVPGVQQPGVNPIAQTDDKTKQILQMLIQASQRKQFSGTPIPNMPQDVSTLPPPQMASHPRQGSFYTIGALIRNGINQEKKNQLLKAEGDWTYLQSGINEMQAAQQSGDQQAIQAAQQKLNVVLADPKKLKNMAKALNQDWLNPEKTTVYGEALKNVMAQQGKKDQATQGLKGMIMKLLGQKQTLQRQAAMNSLSDEQKQQMAREIEKKAPTTQPGLGQEGELLGHVASLEKAITASREKYQYIPSADGKVWAVNKNDPKDAHMLRDADSGDPVKGKASAKENQPVMAAGVPVGIMHNGVMVRPGDPEWSKEDQKTFTAVKDGIVEKQQLRIDPIIADQLPAAPVPSDFAKGKSDPAYRTALANYGKNAEKIKNEMASSGQISRAITWNEFRPVQALDGNGNLVWTYAKNAISGGMSPAASGAAALSSTVQIQDIKVASNHFKDAIRTMDKPFTPDQVAKLTLATRTPDEGMAREIFNTIATQDLTDKQQDFVVWMAQVNERAMSLRKIAGQGQGAEDLRGAIRHTIPAVQSGSKEMMLKQIGAFDNQVAILEKGIPKTKAGAAATGGGGQGELTLDEAKSYLQKAGGDKDKARQLAKADGRTF